MLEQVNCLVKTLSLGKKEQVQGQLSARFLLWQNDFFFQTLDIKGEAQIAKGMHFKGAFKQRVSFLCPLPE